MTTLHLVELRVLGPLQVRQGGLPVAIPGAKPRAILTMLGLHGGSVVSADTLVELLWGVDPPRTAVKALQTHISSLRRALGNGFVLTEGAGWTLAESDVDASRYKSAARLGRDAAAAGDTSQAVARFEQALALWRGIPELPDGRRGTSEKTRWIEGHAALVEDRADALLATGRAAEIIGELEAAVADAPLRERRWGQLMLALYRAGRQGEALGAYQRARALLADELGVDPGPELRRLEAAIVAQDAALEMPGAQDVSVVTRAVTFLLTDIEGSTAAWEAEAEAMAVALARHDELVEQVITSRGGRLIKTRGEGDATFSVFERPSAAAAAAIELQEAIVHEPWALREPMRIRVALHTGEVEFRDGDYFGRAVNRAARLRSLATGGQILCSGATAELVIDSLPDDVVLADLGTRQLRNLARPERVFELQLQTADDRDEAVPTDAPVERPSLPPVLLGPGPFVGRAQELERLSSSWQTALAEGTTAMLIAGEPGVGKTRLAGEWSRQAYDQGALVIYGRCDEDLGAPYQPFAEALRSLVPCLGAGAFRGLRGVEALLTLVPGLTDVVPDLAAPTRADPDTERYALFDAVVALLGVASTGAPVVLILDDLHWAAKPTLLLLRHLLRFGEHARLQIIGTYRSTDLDRSHPLAAMLADLHRDAGFGTGNRLQLSGLDEQDVTAYVAEAGYKDEELARALASVTGGNPFFLIEALRHVDESGGRWDQSTLPQGVREAVSRRLSRLAPETNKALAAAAVVGSRFALELVERVVGDDLVDAFDEARKAGIVIEEPGGRYRFNHALVRQSLLAELPSVRRMRLHQRIATTLEDEPGADDELLAELAYHYFECAWAGNAAKAVEYCRRAADQAMARLAYEGAADLYDRALHALEEIDEELPDRDEQVTALLVARCEALLAAGDVASAAGAVSQLQSATVGSARLAAWATCFDGQLSMLVHPERLDEVEAAVDAAAEKLAELNDAAGEAKAHTVRATCLARLGRIGDCEIALDDALTAARRAREHRRVNNVLANAPLAALWGPNPVPRAGGRCLDVVRLLRITTDSPAVEATSTRCQAVLEAFRGRAAAARRMIDSARRTVTELGLRHALLEVEQFAGIVELVVDDPAAAEPHLRLAYNGFRRMGLDADTAETAALLGGACLVLDRDTEADELCTESERLAGHALKASIAWRTLRARLLARGGDHNEARRIAEAAVSVAERTDALVDHADACSALATVLGAAGDAAGARAAAERAVGLYDRKGAAALADKARSILGERVSPAPAAPEAPAVELDNACVRAIGRLDEAIDRDDWGTVEQQFASDVRVESRRKIVGYPRVDLSPREWIREVQRARELGMVRQRHAVIAVRGHRLALTRLEVGTADVSPGAPQDEMLRLIGLDEEGRIALLLWFDIGDMDAAIAELDATHARFEEQQPKARGILGTRDLATSPAASEALAGEPDNACVQKGSRLVDAVNREAWEEVVQLLAPYVSVESRRKIVGFTRFDVPSSQWPEDMKGYLETGMVRYRQTALAVRSERLALFRLELGTADLSSGAPQDEMLQVVGIDDEGRIALQVKFDVEDIDAAMAELDAAHARFERQPKARRILGGRDLPTVPAAPEAPTAEPDNDCVREINHLVTALNREAWSEVEQLFPADVNVASRRKIVGFAPDDLSSAPWIQKLKGLSRGTGDIHFRHRVIAVRGERLALIRLDVGNADVNPGAPQDEMLQVVGLGESGRIALEVWFDVDDIDAAVAELDARYLTGEAVAHARTWSVIAEGCAALSRGELFPTTPDCVNVDHRRGIAFAPGELTAYIRTAWNLLSDGGVYIETAHRLSNLGAVVTWKGRGSSQEGSDVEFRGTNLLTVEGDLINRVELFDEADTDIAIARFDQLSRTAPQLENAASRVAERSLAQFGARNWDAMAEMLADNFSQDDRRRVVGAGVRHGRDAQMADMRAIADVWITTGTPTVIATRGERLALIRTGYSDREQGNEAFLTETLCIVEINSDERSTGAVSFDLDDLDAAFQELDARYLAGEAAAHAHTWSVIARGFAGLNRRELPATTADWVNIDHRRGTSIAPGEMPALLAAAWNLASDLSNFVVAVHRLTNLGAVITHMAHETSQEGFHAEWRVISVLTLEGDLVNRCEVFDEADLDAALARFDELHPQPRRLENEASQAYERLQAYIAARDWTAVAETVSDNCIAEDRRRAVNAGILSGRDAQIENLQATVDVGFTITMLGAMATRGARLALVRVRVSGRDPQAIQNDAPNLVELDTDGRIAAVVVFDLEDIDAAFGELDARYLAGEAAPYGHTWSVILRGQAALNRHELPAGAPDCVSIDHRRGLAFAPGDLIEYLTAGWELNEDDRTYAEVVHRLSNCGAVYTSASHGVSRDGFDAEWRTVELVTVDGDVVNRCEIFDEEDVDTAIARFNQLSRPAPRLENTASRMVEQFLAHFAAHDWDAMAELIADDMYSDDRRPVVNAGIRRGRDVEMANWRATADVWMSEVKSRVVATRGERLGLFRFAFASQEQEPEAFQAAALGIVEINGEDRAAASIVFDVNDIDAAFEELDARYLAGEAAAHVRTWSVVASSFAEFNRHEVPAADWVTVDHRRGTPFEPSNMTPSIRTIWDPTPNLSIHVEAVHRLDDSGVVITHQGHGTSQEGFDAEWRAIDLLMIDGDVITRCEVFDESDLDAAIARFNQLTREMSRLENAASRVWQRFQACLAAEDWAAMAKMAAEDVVSDDRRRVVGAGVHRGRDTSLLNVRATVDVGLENVRSIAIATRGERLLLDRIHFSGRDQAPEPFSSEILRVLEIGAEEQITAGVFFDLDDIDAALEELDSRYLAGEAAAHSHTWSVITQMYAALNRHELPRVTPNWVNVDHRRGTNFAPGDLLEYLRAGWDLHEDINYYVEAVHRLSDVGAIVTHAVHGRSQEGFSAEWRMIELLTVEGELINRCELFDEADIDAALARFEELHPQTRAPENTASRITQRLHAHFVAHDWDAVTEMLATDVCSDDRRRGVNAGIRHGRDAALQDARAMADLWITNVTSTVIATRGGRLVLMHARYLGDSQDTEAFYTEVLSLTEIDAHEQVVARIWFDANDIDAAFAELDARYVAGEAAPYARVWHLGMGAIGELNRHEPGPMIGQLAYADHRRIPFASGEDFRRGAEELWNLVPDARYRVKTVHALDAHGDVVTLVIQGTDAHGNELQWGRIILFASEDPRVEVYEEDDVDAALARFEELRPPARGLENAASRVYDHFQTCFAARNWVAITEMLSIDVCTEDRRRVVNAGLREGHDAVMAEISAHSDVGVKYVTSDIIATRGEHLVLSRTRASGRDQRPEAFHTVDLDILQIDAEERIVARVVFDANDVDAAFEELDARYLAGEAAPYARAWSAIAAASAAFNRHELSSTTPDSVLIDHRPVVTIEARDLAASIRSTWDVTPDISICIEAVHRLSELGAVVTHTLKGNSPEGFSAEWRVIEIFTVEGDRISRCEIFDEADLDAALTRFEELRSPVRRLENAASQIDSRFWEHFTARQWAAMAELVADDICTDDRRRVVNAGIRHGRDEHMADMRAIAEVSPDADITSIVVATRGACLALTRIRVSHRGLGAGQISTEVLSVVETDADGRMFARVAFDLDDMDGAFAELDTRYLATEAAPYARAWSAIAAGCAAFNRHELPLTTPYSVYIDHRRGVTVEAVDLDEFTRATWNMTPEVSICIEAVHSLSDLGAVVTNTARGTSQEAFDAEWRMIHMFTVDGNLISRSEIFDEADLDAALARFEELQPRPHRLQNAASQAVTRLWTSLATRDWAAMAEIMAENVASHDHRRVVNSGVLRGRDINIANMRAVAKVGFEGLASTVIAIRGQRLALSRIRSSARGFDPGEISADMIGIVEIDADNRIIVSSIFDADDIDAAFEELDARYLASEAAARSNTWSVIAKLYAGFNRHERPATTPDFNFVDHRAGVRIEATDLPAFIDAGWELMRDISIHMEAVHRLNDLGVVVTYFGRGVSQDDFDAEWRMITIFTVDGDLISRCEMFDETDIDAALARFDELQAPTRRLENAATLVAERFFEHFRARNWGAIAQNLTDDTCVDDRRHAANAGFWGGRDVVIANMRPLAGGWTNITITAIATRGEHLALARVRTPNRDLRYGEFDVEMLVIVEIDTEERITAQVLFGVDDFDAAFAELDARYLASEAKHAHTWSVITGAYAAIKRHELPPTTPNFVGVDHRPRHLIEAGDFGEYIGATWDLTPDISYYIESVHGLSNLGSVVTRVTTGTSQEGFDAEWRQIDILTFEDDKINRCEVFDEADVDTALARFEELHPPTRRLENKATRVDDRFFAHFRARNWAAIAEILSDDSSIDDRRRVVNAGLWDGRDVVIANMRALAEGGANITWTVIATRGERLALTRICSSNRDLRHGEFYVEMLGIAEIDGDERMTAHVLFDPDDFDAAFEELEARYLSGEAAEHAHTWSVMTGAYAAVNRRELPPTTPDWANIDHRRGIAFAPGNLEAYLHASWDVLAPDINAYIETVHRLTDIGAVVTRVVEATSREGFQAEWREIGISTVKGDLINRSEIFDETDLDAALARFDELQPQPPRPENAASRVAERYQMCFSARDWDTMAELLADDIVTDDRRRVVNAGIRHGRDVHIADNQAAVEVGAENITLTVIATRGERLALASVRTSNRGLVHGFGAEMLGIVEINTGGRITALVTFDSDDIDAAFKELDTRYLAGEATAHAHTWSVNSRLFAGFNRHELPATTPDWVYIDHRPLITIEPSDLQSSVRALWDLTPDLRIYMEAVHRLSDLGAVVTAAVYGTSHEGFNAEWRMIDLFTVEGDLASRCEIFDEADLDAALARFDELNRPAPLENSATRIWLRMANAFNRRDFDGFLALTAADVRGEDRQKGLRASFDRAVGPNVLQAMFDATPSWRLEVEPIAIRDARFALTRNRYRDAAEAGQPITSELLTVIEVGVDGLVHHSVSFDPEDINDAFAELTARWIASGEVAHPGIIETMDLLIQITNRHDWDELARRTVDATFSNHRQLASPGADTIPDYLTSIRTVASLIPDFWVELAEILTRSTRGFVAHQIVKGTSTDGVAIEIPILQLVLLDGTSVTHIEAFDPAQRDLALARFDELNPSS